MSKIKYLALLVSMITFSSTFAADSSSGCGLGWAVLKKNSLVSSSLRATTNGIFLNTVAMTFGTSGCAKHSIVQNDAKGMHFTQANYYQLMAEMAQGNGEYVSGLAQAMGCQNVEATFAQEMKSSYRDVFASGANAVTVYQNVKRQVQNNELLNRNCNII